MSARVLLLEKLPNIRLEKWTQKRVQTIRGEKQKWENENLTRSFAFQVKRNEKLGRYMVASRDLKAGEVLFRELAVVHGPKMLSHMICLGCHKSLSLRTSKATFYRCSRCAWPLCSKSCETKDPHLEECALMSSKAYKCPIKGNCDTVNSEAIYCLIFPLRMLLLKRRQPKMWAFSVVTGDFHDVLCNVLSADNDNCCPAINVGWTVWTLSTCSEESALSALGRLSDKTFPRFRLMLWI